MFWALALVAFIIAALIGIWFLKNFYAKASLETALVRTGLGGRRVLTDGGCIALPILHQVQRVSMQATSITSSARAAQAVLTRDQLRADIEMEFELRVAPDTDSIATAAQALGHRIARSGEAIGDVLAGPLSNAIQTMAAQRSLDEIHLDRAGFTTGVAAMVEDQANRLGLTLVSASLVTIDQSDLNQMNENNAFNAKGMRHLAELIAEERKARVAAETSAEIAVREFRLTQHQRQLELRQAEREAEIAQTEYLARSQAQAEARADEVRATARRDAEAARIEQERATKTAQVQSDEALRQAEMSALLTLEEAKIDNEIQLAKKRAEEAEAKALAEASRAQVILAAEEVQAQKDRAISNREREIALMQQEKDSALEAARVKSDVDTLLTRAQAEAKAKATEAATTQQMMEAEAKGRAALHNAENALSDAVIRMRLEERKLDRMPEIMTQMMKPVEKIDSIRINQIGGGMGSSAGLAGANGSSDGVDGAFGAAMDQILGMAVRLPAMKQMGEEIGLDFDPNLAGRTADYANRIKAKELKPASPKSDTPPNNPKE